MTKGTIFFGKGHRIPADREKAGADLCLRRQFSSEKGIKSRQDSKNPKAKRAQEKRGQQIINEKVSVCC